jgi:DsbC/DsbD-like thiol-disulfide interchange protein/cytochrome c biogenesis protein CcdA
VLHRLILLLLALLLTPALTHARGIEPELVAEGPVQPGGEVELALHMRTKPGWHGYWLNPGDAGLPMTVDWQLPDGASAGELRYPVPGRLLIAGLMNYVYERDYAVLVRFKAPTDARGTIPLRAKASWLACTDKICVPESGEVTLDLAVGTGEQKRALFDQWRQALPRPLGSPAKFEVAGKTLRLAIPLPRDVPVKGFYAYPVTQSAIAYAGPQTFTRSGDILIAELPLGLQVPAKFDAVVTLRDGRGLQVSAAPGTVPRVEQGATGSGSRALLLALVGALAGGILLNLMPCVFPILALKALHLARSGGGGEREARRDALAYGAGAIVGTGALGIALLAIRAGGTAAGWAFQLQDPRTLLILLLLTTAITLNLAGLFSLPVLGGRAHPAGGFGTGLLAAFVATPCAGPFMGAALGTALLLPVAGSVLVFAALGLGLAMPFLVVAFIPALRERLPRPGAWMVRLQRFLAVPMALTALACLWLLSRQAGSQGLLIGAFAVALMTILLIGYRYAQRGGRSAGRTVAAVAFVISAGAIAAMPRQGTEVGRSIAGVEQWSEARVATYVQQGKPVFVYFTADWCLTCKANEAAAIDRSEVRSAFRKADVKVLAGDWTNGDPAITRFLESRGRAGVPLYLWYTPGKPPEELPQILTPTMLANRAAQAG